MDGTLKQSQLALDASIKASRIDQRAWIKPEGNTTVLSFASGQELFVPFRLTNSGKTPAKDLSGSYVLQLIHKSEAPDFLYSPGHPHNISGSNLLFPNESTLLIQIYAVVRGPSHMILTQSQIEELVSGELRAAVYGIVNYDDIFGGHHWVTFCNWLTIPGAPPIGTESQKTCLSYTGTDKN
jgi:hypothetical protein